MQKFAVKFAKLDILPDKTTSLYDAIPIDFDPASTCLMESLLGGLQITFYSSNRLHEICKLQHSQIH